MLGFQNLEQLGTSFKGRLNRMIWGVIGIQGTRLTLYQLEIQYLRLGEVNNAANWDILAQHSFW